jgi:hypothetical protein
MSIDRERLVALLDALDASPTCLERPVCRGWVGDWQITGKHGHAMTDGDAYLIYATTPERDIVESDGKRRSYGSPRRWASIKKTLGFAKIVQEGDDECIFRLDGLPNEVEAEAIRGAVGIRKRRHMSEAQIERSRSVLASARSLINRGSYAAGSI